MKRYLVLFLVALYLLCGRAACATVYTSNASGNWSDSTKWTPNGVPAAGDTVLIGHQITVTADATAGISPPQTPTTVAVTSTSSGGTVTALATGSYKVNYTFVDANGGESAWVISDITTGALTVASSKPRVTLPALPSGVSSINLYLTDTGGAANTEHLYATGIVGTTYDLVSALYNNGTQTYAQAAAEPSNCAVQINNGFLKINDGIKLTCRGDIWQKAIAVTLIGAAAIEFDPSSAASPGNAKYTWWEGSSNTQGACQLLTSTTSSSKIAQIRTNATGGNGAARFRVYGTAFGDAVDTTFWNVSYLKVIRMGDSSNDCVRFEPSATTFVDVIDHTIFDTCGKVNWISNAPATSGWNITYTSWKATNAASSIPLVVAANATLSSGTRTIDHCCFDQAPTLTGYQSTYTSDYFALAYTIAGGTVQWTSMDSCYITNHLATPNIQGPLTNSLIIVDSAPTASATGTATSGGNTTLTNSGAAYSTNQYQANTSGNTTGWTLVITGGTGAGQCRSILSNTATAFTVLRAWDTNPDATSTYAVYGCNANPHVLGCQTIGGSSVTISGCFFQSYTGDNNGDLLYPLSAGITFNILNNIFAPSIARDNSGTPITTQSTFNGANVYVITHNTAFAGPQSWAVNEGAGSATCTTGGSTTHVLVTSNPGWLAGEELHWRHTTTTTALRDTQVTITSIAGGTDATVPTLAGTPVSGDTFTYNEIPGIITSLKNNITWNEAGKTYALAGAGGGASAIGPYELCDTGSPSPATFGDRVQDIVTVTATVSNADYNDSFNLLSNGASNGAYNVNSSVTMGTHDLAVDPQFVSPWRSVGGWGNSISLSSSADPFVQIAAVRAALAAANDPSDGSYNAAATIAALYAYVRAGFAPQNAALHNTGSDSLDIGAVAYVANGRTQFKSGPAGVIHSQRSGGHSWMALR